MRKNKYNKPKIFFLVFMLCLMLSNVVATLRASAQVMHVGTGGVAVPGAGFPAFYGGGYNGNNMMGSGGWGGYPQGFAPFCSVPGFIDPSCINFVTRGNAIGRSGGPIGIRGFVPRRR